MISEPPKVLLLYAHPEAQDSVANQMLLKAAATLSHVTVHDLYAHYPDFFIDIPHEQQLLRDHQVIVFQHPLYTYSCPALLKEWLDRVLTRGFASGVGAAQVAITAALLGAALIGGIGLAMSSTAIALQLMRDKGMNCNEGGQLGFSVLLFQDMAVIPALSLIPFLSGGHGDWMKIGIKLAAFFGMLVAIKGTVSYILAQLPGLKRSVRLQSPAYFSQGGGVRLRPIFSRLGAENPYR